MDLATPEAFDFLYEPGHHRFRGAFGGRGSGKSHAFAQALIFKAWLQPMRILCAREIQLSIKESVKKLLDDKIDQMGLSRFYKSTDTEIRGQNGSQFIFAGLRTDPQKIKSMEGLNICWIEEASTVSERSLELLTPTLRAPNSEIWATWNPDSPKDPIDVRLRAPELPPGWLVRKVNYTDNPWFPATLLEELEQDRRIDPEKYAHVWLGEYRSISDAQVLKGRYAIETFEPQPGWNGPYYGADWGFSVDPTALVRVWIHEKKLYVEHEAFGHEVPIHKLPDLFAKVPGSQEHVIRSDCSRPETIDAMHHQGWKRVIAANKWPGSVEDGVEHLRSYEKIIIHPRCTRMFEEARLWQYKTDRLTGDVLPVLKDGNDHGWDAVRYAVEPMVKRRNKARTVNLHHMAR